MTPKPLSGLEPHHYAPSTLHMGDCAVCGHLQGAPIHSPFRIKQYEREQEREKKALKER